MVKKDYSTLISIALILFLFIHADFKEKEIIKKLEANSSRREIKIPEKYGIPIPDFKIEERQIKAGMFFSDIFSDINITGEQIYELLDKAKDVFDVRKLRIGNKYTVFYENDTLKKAKYVVYEKSQTEYVVFDLSKTLNVKTGFKPVKTEIKSSGGIIESSLWLAMQDAGINPLLANNLSEIYAWSIDFFGLQKNDKFKVIYEELFVDGQSIGFGKIKSAFFEHNGQEIYAIPFKQDSVEEFFDAVGNNLRKAFLKAPLKYSHIGSRFSNSRFHPILKIYRPHHGIDYSAPAGTPVFALGDGTVIHAGYAGQSGHYIKIKHNGTYTTGYLHLRAYAEGIHQGSRVRQGQVIGYVGSTGLSTGPHLDFRVWKNDVPVDPLKIDAPPSNPIKAENREIFVKTVGKYKNELDVIKY
jgi:murein DD-endopeptidase MepM/ murein hydrolase activator NlpD